MIEYSRDKKGVDGYRTVCKACAAAHNKAWYQGNRQRVMDRVSQWQASHPDKAIQYKRNYIEAHPDRRAESLAKHKPSPDAIARAKEKRQAPAYKAQAKARREAYRDGLHDCYVRRLLAQKTSLKGSDMPAALVEAKRLQLMIERECREQSI